MPPVLRSHGRNLPDQHDYIPGRYDETDLDDPEFECTYLLQEPSESAGENSDSLPGQLNYQIPLNIALSYHFEIGGLGYGDVDTVTWTERHVTEDAVRDVQAEKKGDPSPSNTPGESSGQHDGPSGDVKSNDEKSGNGKAKNGGLGNGDSGNKGKSMETEPGDEVSSDEEYFSSASSTQNRLPRPNLQAGPNPARHNTALQPFIGPWQTVRQVSDPISLLRVGNFSRAAGMHVPSPTPPSPRRDQFCDCADGGTRHADLHHDSNICHHLYCYCCGGILVTEEMRSTCSICGTRHDNMHPFPR